MKHRHLDVPAEVPVEGLPSAAIADRLERGDLDDWRPIAAAIAADPEGALAERVLRLADAYPMYGTSCLWRAWILRRRDMARAGAGGAAAAPSTLAELRRERRLTQAELSRRMGISQSDLSKLERRGDLRVSTLRGFAAALGGRLRLLVEHAEGATREVRLPEGPRPPRPRRKGSRRSRGGRKRAAG